MEGQFGRFDVGTNGSSSTADLISEIRKPSKDRVVLSVAVVLLLSLSTTFIVLYLEEKNDDSKGQKVCSSPECVISSNDILQKLDTSVKPCDNFYQYSCGGFVKNRHILDGKRMLGSFGTVLNLITYSLKDLLEDKQLMLNFSKDLNYSAVYKAFSFYKSCMNQGEIEANGRKPILDVIKHYGLNQSIIFTNKTRTNDSWILEKIIARVLDLGTAPFIGLNVILSPFNTSQVVVGVGRGSSGFERQVEENLISTSTKQPSYKEYMSSVFQLLGALPGPLLNQTVYDIYNLENKFYRLKSSLEKQVAKVGYRNALKLMTLDELNNFTSFKFNWTIYFEEVLRGTNKSIGPNQKLLVALPDNIRNITDLLYRQPKSLLADAITWNVVVGFVNSLPKSFQKAENEFLQIITSSENPKTRWRTCASATNIMFEYVTALLFANKYLSEDARKRAEGLFLEIKEQFINGLEEQTWMDNKTRNEARTKVSAMKQSIAYPPFIKDSMKLNKFYEKIYVSPSNLFQNQLNIFKANLLDKIDQLGKPPDNTRFNVPPIGVNANYGPRRNKMTVLMGMLQKPFYEGDRLKALNYGSLGAIIGHEITHGFDISGSKFDSKGNLRSWWTKESLDNFKKRASCLVKQYNKVKIFGRKVNGVKTLSENIADNGGLKYAFRAYRKWRDANGDEDKLPALNFTNNQLFMISYAQTWCTKYRGSIIINYLMKTDEHALNPVRVLVPLSNFPEFRKAFGCKAPAKPCAVW